MPESYTGDEGTTAFNAGLEIMDGTEDRRQGWLAINKTRDMLVTFATNLFNSITLTWESITGKPATFPPSAHQHTINDIRTADNSGPYGPALQAVLDGKLPIAGGTMTGHLFSPPARSTPVTSSFVAAYLNADGRLGATPSALKYKRDIADYDGSALGLRAVTYVLKDDPLETVRLGIIADDANDIEPLLVVHEDGEPESFKYELLAVALLADVQRLTHRIEELEARDESA